MDIYALGCVFYEMLTGQRPYQGTTPTEIMLKKVDEAVPRAGALHGTAWAASLIGGPLDRKICGSFPSRMVAT